MRVRVVVAENDPLLCEGLAASLSETPEFAAWPSHGPIQAALERCLENPPTVLVASESLVETADTRRFAEQVDYGRAVPVLVLGPSAHPENILCFLRLGCVGYVHRAVSLAVLRRAITAVVAGQMWAPRTVLTQLLRQLIDGRSRGPHLTVREREILGLIRSGSTNSQIAGQLFISPETVRWHVRRVFVKIGARDRASAAQLARLHLFPLPAPLPLRKASSATGGNGVPAAVSDQTAGIVTRF